MSIRHNDLFMLWNSSANEEVFQAQLNVLANARKVMYGDSIFPWRSCLRARHGANAQDPQKAWKDRVDKSMSSARELVEHHYGEADSYFPFMSYSKKLKVVNMDLASLYTCKVLLRNFYPCLYGNKTPERFNCQPVSLEVYAAQKHY